MRYFNIGSVAYIEEIVKYNVKCKGNIYVLTLMHCRAIVVGEEEFMARRNTRYSDKVVTFAVSQRVRGEPWEKIKRDIARLFKIEPPTERRMRDWVKLWGEIKATKTSKYVTFNIPKRLKGVFEKTHDIQQYMVISSRVMGSVYDAWQRRDDPMIAWVLEMLCIIEQVTGRKALEEALARYQGERTEESSTSSTKEKADLVSKATRDRTANPMM